MSYRNTILGYGSITKWLHWLIALFVICLLIIGFFMDDISSAATKHFVFNLHKLFGLTVLALMFLRITWTLGNIIPPLPTPVEGWERLLLNTVKILFYLSLILMPLSGWVMATASGKPPHLFSMYIAAPGIPVDKHLADTAYSVHAFLAWTILVLLFLHISGAVKHQFINKDNLLRRMLPENWFLWLK